MKTTDFPAESARAAASLSALPLPAVVVELGRLIERRMHQAMGGNGLSASQFMTLLRIAADPGISRADLARRLQISPQAVGGLTGQLLGKGLIERTRSDRGQAIEFTVTDEGYDLLDEVQPAVDDLAQEMLRFFRPNLAMAVNGTLRHLLNNL